MSDIPSLSREEARRIAVACQALSGAPPEPGIEGIRRVLRKLRCLQLDPVNTVARSHLLVLWSRLGNFDPSALDKLRWDERWLFEYWAHAASIVLTEDYQVHHVMMRKYPVDARTRGWLADNEEFRRYVVELLAASGPLPPESIEDRSVVGWVSTGWTNGRNTERLLDTLWKQGVVTVAGRDGLRRLWSLAAFPQAPELSERDAVERAAELALLALGVARERDVIRHFTCGRYPGLDLAAYGFARRVRVEGGTEDWWVHRDVAEPMSDGDRQPRTTLLSPFDNLICDRARTLRLWDFDFKNEIYVPKHKRQYGAYTMPILHGDRLIGRVVSRTDRKRGVLVVEGVFAEPDAPADAGPGVAAALRSLATFVGAGAGASTGTGTGAGASTGTSTGEGTGAGIGAVSVTGPVPAPWASALRAGGQGPGS